MSRDHLDIVSRWEQQEEAVVVEPKLKSQNWFEISILPITLGLLFFLPLIFGGKQIWALGMTKAVIWIVLAALAFKFVSKGETANEIFKLHFGKFGKLLISATILVSVLGLVQLFPIPVSFLDFLSPRTAELYRASGAYFGSLSLERVTTLSDLSWILSCLAFGALLTALPYRPMRTALSLHRKRMRQQNPTLERAREMDSIANSLQLGLVWLGLILSLVAIGHWVFGSTLLFGIFEAASGEVNPTRAHWPFVNPDHLSFVLQISVLTTTSRFLRLNQLIALRRNKEQEGFEFGFQLLRRPERFGKQLAYAGAIFLLTIANFLTFSRAGIGLMIFGFCLLWMAYRKFPARIRLRSIPSRSRYQSKALSMRIFNQLYRFRGLLLAVGMVLGVIFFVGETSRDLAAQRLEYGLTAGSESMRYEFLRSSIKVMIQYPLFGVGLGGWKFAAAAVSPRELAGWKLDYAHNDLAQFLAEAGIGGLILLSWFVFVVGKSLRSIWRESLPSSVRFQIIAGGISCVVPILHILVDFPLHIPGAAFAAVIALVIFFRSLEACAEHKTAELETKI